ncbi:MAG: polymer-forming cytoskeletal protein [Desulfobacterales bacterium]|nr:polymer-forming cytoskeletal protein [Desulfobacterales bacterium]
MKKTNDVALLGVNTVFEGRLSFHGTVRIEGHFKGDISSDGTLVIGEHGIIEADINSSCVVISGEVHGNINADSSIEILAEGKVYGNIFTPSLIIHEGVIFEGRCRMDKTKDAPEKEFPEQAPDKKGLIKFFPSGKNKNEKEELRDEEQVHLSDSSFLTTMQSFVNK